MTYDDTAAGQIRVRHVQANIVHINTTLNSSGNTYAYSNLNQCINGAALDGLAILPDFLAINEGWGNGPSIIQAANDNGYGVAAIGINPADNSGTWVDQGGNKNPILFNRDDFDFVAFDAVELHPDTYDPSDGNTIASRWATFLTVQDRTPGKGSKYVICNVHIDTGYHGSDGHDLTTLQGTLGKQSVSKFATEVDTRRAGDAIVIWGGDMNMDFFQDRSVKDAQMPYMVYTGKGMIPIYDEKNVPDDSKAITHGDVGDTFPQDDTRADFSSGSTLDWVGTHSGDARIYARSFETKTMLHSDHKAVFTRWNVDYPPA